MFRPLSSRSISPSAGQPPIAAKLFPIAAVADLERGMAALIVTLSRSVQWTEATRIRDQRQLLAFAYCDLTVQRSFTIAEIAVILRVKTTQVKRQLQELNTVKGDRTVGDKQSELLSTMGRLTQENERLKGEMTSLKIKVQRRHKLRDDKQAESCDCPEIIADPQAECSSKDGMIQLLTCDVTVLSLPGSLIQQLSKTINVS
jgi:hypothetical protein